MSSNFDQNSQTPLIINGCPAEIHIQQRDYYYYDYPNDFVVDFTLMKLVYNRNHARRINYPKITHKSYPSPFNPTNIYKLNMIDFALVVELQLGDDLDLRNQVKRRIANYVKSNLREPKTLSVSIIVHQEDEVRESKGLRSRMLSRMLKKVKHCMKGLKEEEKDDEDECCSICLVNFDKKQKEERVTSMPCKHVFHEECILKWLMLKPLCPLCRFELHV